MFCLLTVLLTYLPDDCLCSAINQFNASLSRTLGDEVLKHAF